MRIAIQGEAGSNSDLAVRELLAEQEVLACSISAEVFERVVSGVADAAVLPIENSLHGAVADHSDLLLEHDVVIIGERSLRIRHALIAAPGTAMVNVRRVLSHPVALSQCRRFFREHSAMQAIPAYDTAGSVLQVVSAREKDAAAIAAPYAAEVYGGVILQRDLEDVPENFTRFLLLARPDRADEIRAVADQFAESLNATREGKMSVAFAIPHQPGSLVNVLRQLAGAGADLCRIESRPVPGRPWEYVFFVDLRLGGGEAGAVLGLLTEGCSMVKVLGEYTVFG